jgi:hypothetical protein
VLGADSFLVKANSFTEFKETLGPLLTYFGDYHRSGSDTAGFAPRGAGTLHPSAPSATRLSTVGAGETISYMLPDNSGAKINVLGPTISLTRGEFG